MAEATAAIVLAAGNSSRLGRPKQLVVFRDETLVRRAARLALEAGAHPVIAVVGAEREPCRAALEDLPVAVVPNPEHAEGMGSSLRSGMAALANLAPSAERVLVLVCDQPLLRLEHLQALLAAPGTIAAAQYGGRLAVPAVFSREHFPALAAATGDQGARFLLRSHPATPVPMPEAAVDIDRPEDLRALEG